jgi:hypothetical protein
MAVLVDYDEDQCQLVVHVVCKDVSSDREIENTFNELDTTLGKIEEKLESDIPFFLINIEAEGVPSGLGEFLPYEDELRCQHRNSVPADWLGSFALCGMDHRHGVA